MTERPDPTMRVREGLPPIAPVTIGWVAKPGAPETVMQSVGVLAMSVAFGAFDWRLGLLWFGFLMLILGLLRDYLSNLRDEDVVE